MPNMSPKVVVEDRPDDAARQGVADVVDVLRTWYQMSGHLGGVALSFRFTKIVVTPGRV